MLAPRKTLWSTPDAVIEKIVERMELKASDNVLDVGCGDGRVILQWAKALSSSQSADPAPSFVGIDIDPARINEANIALKQARDETSIDTRIEIAFHCANALESEQLINEANIIFLYLIPRGLRIIKPLLMKQLSHGKTLEVVSYMSPLVDETPTRVERIPVPHQPEAVWPLYFYKLTAQ
jgi:SAM-dependent methyltransferase